MGRPLLRGGPPLPPPGDLATGRGGTGKAMTTIRLTNSAARTKQDFVPLDERNVRVYLCGPTVYDRAHMGNARSAVVFDTLFRLLRSVYGVDRVTYVRNVTDVDDKINARAAETGRDIADITTETGRWYVEDMAALGCLPPTEAPRATAHIPGMVAMIERLVAMGHAYVADAHVLFSVASYPRYGALSGRSVEDMLAGARVEVAPYKRDPMDFVLWKPAEPGTPGWDSPWGRGRPGWHIECSAMSEALLGETFDIHAGGGDLLFPHHENEIAQSVCAHAGAPMAQYWLHNEMLQVEGRKMSKSLGNFFTVRDMLDEGVPGEVIRMVLLSAHYRKPMDWTAERVRDAEATLKKWRRLSSNVEAGEVSPAVVEALADDLNTHGALNELHRLAGKRQLPDLIASARLLGLLDEGLATWSWQEYGVDQISGGEVVSHSTISGGALGHADTSTALQKSPWAAERIASLISHRQTARNRRDFGEADRIRDSLAAAGVSIKDTPEGATWELRPDFDPAKLKAVR